MTREEILAQQVEALEKLLQLKQAIVEELEAKVSRLQNPYPLGGGTINIPWQQPYYGGGGAGGVFTPGGAGTGTVVIGVGGISSGAGGCSGVTAASNNAGTGFTTKAVNYTLTATSLDYLKNNNTK